MKTGSPPRLGSRPAATLASRLAAAAATALLGGCLSPVPRPLPSPLPGAVPPAAAPSATAPAAPAGAPPAAPAPRPPAPPRENHLSAATQSLVTQARGSMTHGDFDAASSTLDRALHIEPNNPLLWIELGRLRLAELDPHQAEGCGRKALALASGDRATQRQAGRLLADALRALGRNPQAREVESLPFMN